MISAIPITTTKFGPSGSLKRENIIFESTIDVIPNIINEVFFDLEFILFFTIYREFDNFFQLFCINI